jgi:hypothetical protein
MSIKKKYGCLILFFLLGCIYIESCAAQPKTLNLLMNSTFQLHTDNMPHYWGCDSFTMRHLKTDTNWFEIDDDTPIQGCKSVRFNKSELAFHSYPLQSPNDKEYTFSCYLKSDLPKAKAIIRMSYADNRGEEKEVELTNQWKRYSFTAIPLRSFWKAGHVVAAVVGAVEGRTWMAAPQLEFGTMATIYRPSKFDNIIQKRWIEDRQNGIPGKPVPELQISKLSNLPHIDGVIENAEWQDAELINGFCDAYTGGSVPENTKLYVGYDDENLYVAFKCIEPDIDEITSLSGEKKLLWSQKNDDYVMIQLAADSTSELSSCFKINVFGEKRCTRNTHSAFKFVFDPLRDGCRYPLSSTVNNQGWDAEFKIPFSHGNIFTKDKTINVNFFRMRRRYNLPKRQAQWLTNPERCGAWLSTIGLSCWSPTYGPEDTYARNGVLRPVDLRGIQKYFYHFKNPRWIVAENDTFFCADIDCFNENATKLKLNIKNQFAELPKSREIDVAGARAKKIRIPFGPKSKVGPMQWDQNHRQPPESAKAVCRLVDMNTKDTILDFDSNVIKTPIDDSFSLLTEFDYYTSEKIVNLIVRSWSDKPISFSFDVLDANNKKIEMSLQTMPIEIQPKSCLDIELDISLLPPAQYVIVATGKNKAGVSYYAKANLLKYPDNETEVKISRRNGALYRNGIGILPYSFAGQWDDDVDLHGFNARFMWNERFFVSDRKELWPQQRVKYKQMLDHLYSSGKMVIIRQVGTKEQQVLDDILSHPVIIAKNFIDEPYHKTREELEALYKAEKKKNPYRPAFINWGSEWTPGVGGSGTLYATDIASIDYYPFNYWGRRPGGGVIDVARWTGKMKTDSLLMGKAIGFWNQLYAFDFIERHFTFSEMKAVNYLCLINNVRLFFYFRGKPASLNLWDSMKEFADEVKILQPYLLDRKSHEIGSGIANYAIRYTLWDSPAGLCLITCNPLRIPLDAEIDLSDIIDCSTKDMTILFEEKQKKVTKGKLKDRWKAFGRNVYIFEK